MYKVNRPHLPPTLKKGHCLEHLEFWKQDSNLPIYQVIEKAASFERGDHSS
jgi:hypothetical protein